MKVWIDQDLCTGDGIRTEICPTSFEMHDDGLAYVKEEHWKSIAGTDDGKGDPALKMAEGMAAGIGGTARSRHRVSRGLPRREYFHRSRLVLGW